MTHIHPDDLITYTTQPTLQICFHLAVCSECRAELRFVRFVVGALIDGPPVPEELIEKTIRVVEREMAGIRRSGPESVPG
jgi:hypothetical protein